VATRRPRPAARGAGPAPHEGRPERRTSKQTKQLPPYNVVLLDDDDHTYDYVIEMLGKVFAHPTERAMQMAKEVDSSGRGHRPHDAQGKAELKRDQILAYGPDQRLASSTRSMQAVIEPAEGSE
jgi:ATP-dependent Clp protease adaptor protein ClpS